MSYILTVLQFISVSFYFEVWYSYSYLHNIHAFYGKYEWLHECRMSVGDMWSLAFEIELFSERVIY